MIEVIEINSENELLKLWKIQLEAFQEDAQQSPEYSPGREKYETLLEKKEKFQINKVIFDKKIIGAIFLRKCERDTSWKISRIFLKKEFQNKGIGSEILKKIEKKYFCVQEWIVETPQKNIKSQKFYKKNGFVEQEIIKITENLNTILLKKVIL